MGEKGRDRMVGQEGDRENRWGDGWGAGGGVETSGGDRENGACGQVRRTQVRNRLGDRGMGVGDRRNK